ncbi:hypothetical protein T484DRAFT_1805568, partial [Baffinella frigidus]
MGACGGWWNSPAGRLVSARVTGHADAEANWAEKPLAKNATGPARVLAASINPYLGGPSDGGLLEVVTCAVDGLSFLDVDPSDWSYVRRERCMAGDEFEGGEHGTRNDALKMGKELLSRPVLAARFLDAQNLAAGSVDGKVYIISRRCLALAVDAHAGAVMDIDAPGGRRVHSGELMISKRDGGRLGATVRAFGAQTDASLGALARGAMRQVMHKHYEGAPHQTGKGQMQEHALVVWDSEEQDLFATGGADGVLRVWRFEPQLVIGSVAYMLGECFDQFGKKARAGHKFRNGSMNAREFLAFLDGVALLQEPDGSGIGGAGRQRLGLHGRVSDAEAVLAPGMGSNGSGGEEEVFLPGFRAAVMVLAPGMGRNGLGGEEEVSLPWFRAAVLAPGMGRNGSGGEDEVSLPGFRAAVGKVVDLVGVKAVAGERLLTRQLALLDEELEALLAAQLALLDEELEALLAAQVKAVAGERLLTWQLALLDEELEALFRAQNEHEYNVLRVAEQRKRLQLAVKVGRVSLQKAFVPVCEHAVKVGRVSLQKAFVPVCEHAVASGDGDAGDALGGGGA